MNEVRVAPVASPISQVSRAVTANRSSHLAPDCRGLNFFSLDHNLRDLLPLYMDAQLLAHLQPYLSELGEVAGGRLNELSEAAERHPPVLRARDRNSSRVSHLARASGMMRRCLNEAMQAARQRSAFGKAVIDHPLMQRQLVKLIVPTEQALSALFHAASVAGHGDRHARAVLRILTPIYKYRACRDNVTVATGAMEARGGNGYVEDWPNARLVRDAHLGLIWEGTSNINGLDAIQRAVAKERAHVALSEDLHGRLDAAPLLPGQFRARLQTTLERAIRYAEQVSANRKHERFCRTAANQLYQAVTSVLLAIEGVRLGAAGGDARRLLLARFVLEHRLQETQATSMQAFAWENEAIPLVLGAEPVPFDRAAAVVAD